jgi:signal transduction histidine kinase
MKKIRLPVFVKITVPLALIVALCIGLSGFRIYQASSQHWRAEMEQRLERITHLIATTVDPAKLQQIRTSADMDGPIYRDIVRTLDQAATAGNIDGIAIYYREGDALYYWVVSKTSITPDTSIVGHPFSAATEAHFAVFEDQQPRRVTYADKSGAYYGFVVPIVVTQPEDRDIIGLVEATVAQEAIQLFERHTLARVVAVLIGGTVIAISATVLLGYLMLYRPLQQLQNGALALVNGNLGYVIHLTSDDELSDLANTLNRMSVELAGLYARLQATNRALETRVKARTTELRKERNRLDTILQNIADGLVVTDMENRVVLVNPAFSHIAQIPREAIQGRLLHEVLPMDDLNTLVTRVLEQPQQILETQIVWKASALDTVPHIYRALACGLIERPAEEDNDALSANSPVSTTTRTLGVVTILHDITRETEVDRMKTEFISMVSHELRTPMTSVLGFTKLIRKMFDKDIVPQLSDHPPVQRAVRRIYGNMDIIMDEGERLTRLINDVLDIAKIESGKIEWHIHEVDVEDIVRRAVSGTTALVRQKKLTIHMDIAPDLPIIQADGDRLIQVITNLLSNAIKFTDKGQIDIIAQAFNWSDDETTRATVAFADRLTDLPTGLWIAISVRDSGIGIAPEDIPKVFEKFRQVGDGMVDRPKGTGLGLPISKEIVEYHGGRIWVQSNLGEGSTFTFVLPMHHTPSPKLREGGRG